VRRALQGAARLGIVGRGGSAPPRQPQRIVLLPSPSNIPLRTRAARCTHSADANSRSGPVSTSPAAVPRFPELAANRLPERGSLPPPGAGTPLLPVFVKWVEASVHD